MPAPTDRLSRLNPELQKTLSEVLNGRIEVPLDMLISITKVHASDDLMHATVFVSVLPDSKQHEGMGFLIRNRQLIKKELGRRWKRYCNTPQLLFKYDDTNQRVAEIGEMIDSEDPGSNW